MIKAESVAELTNVLKESEQKMDARRQQEQAAAAEAQAAEIKARQDEMIARQQFEAQQRDLDRQKDILEAEIRATSQIGGNRNNDLNLNLQNDQIDAMERIQKQDNYTEQMNFKREQEINKNMTNQSKLDIERQKLQTQREIAEKQLQIAKENKTKSELRAAGKLKGD